MGRWLGGTVLVKDSYQNIVAMVERLHRHFLDVLRTEMRRVGVDDINAVQALLLSNIGDNEVVIRDLKDRGYYHGSNVSYNIKKLTECGYLSQERSPHDRRATILQLTDKGMALCKTIQDLQKHLSESLERNENFAKKIADSGDALHILERVWTDFIRYGR
ncbi:MAG: MarR family transcriptional regulator [Alphaproteobacteria bacterium RIFOXYD12_FULL_60_8]|nr:MAG: MarR family transcriptional regulator [Alphaproteobacteria bacterium RIFOXYD12_FULL_60_8]